MSAEKHDWSSLVGKDGNEAVEIIKKETGFSSVDIIPPDTMCTKDYRTNRVRVYVDKQGKVTSTPNIG
ncbi:unnamed protein product [Adineta steineri]|uniref:Uncharacterized protein n=1 Tax=Adineta steineri TaxID=433720 RepID=A0A813QRG6_9BILA|nr:unnamed protein product [Adineta steineri]CAF0770673.1 unnamed protein product [Adineta steineri]CAF0815982.1 unnamed protein product [Adineta steineri]